MSHNVMSDKNKRLKLSGAEFRKLSKEKREKEAEVLYVIIRVFSPRAGPSLQAQEPRLQFCRRQVFHRKFRNQGCSVTTKCNVKILNNERTCQHSSRQVKYLTISLFMRVVGMEF